MVALLGCHSAEPKSAGPVPGGDGPLTEIHLLSSPAAVNFESLGGAAGFAVRIYASDARHPKTVPIRAGTLEILMFDGILTSATASSAKPLRVWTYPADALAPSARMTSVGTCYLLTALFGEIKPIQDRITVLACYTAPQGAKIYSAPAILFVSAR